VSPEALESARVIFDYHQLRHAPAPADLMVVLGTNDTRVADFAAAQFHQGIAETVVVTGGIAHQGDLLATDWDRPEAEVFADILVAQGVPSARILLETEATNTAENIRFSKRLITARGLSPTRVALVMKPFMQRRVLATHVVEWPEMPASIVSWNCSFDEYCTAPGLEPDKIANIMMGDLQRIWIYATRGYSAPQILPDEVRGAYLHLKGLGFTHHLIPEPTACV
jgi:uncharacterized SAM-binding protein YcdF (DUF218 family)